MLGNFSFLRHYFENISHLTKNFARTQKILTYPFLRSPALGLYLGSRATQLKKRFVAADEVGEVM